MSGRMLREAYEKLIAENITWLMTCPQSLEREHILAVLQCSVDHEYRAARTDAQIAELVAVLRELADCAEYWSEYDVPIGIHDRIKTALAKAGADE